MALSTTRLIVPHSLTRSDLHTKPPRKLQTLVFNPICQRSAISKPNYGSCFLVKDQGLRYFSNDRRARSDRNTKMDLAVHSSIPPGAPLPSVPTPDSWKGWILGALITVILPFFRHKWGPLFKLTKEIEAAVETADYVAEVIEKVAEQVDKVAEEVADDLPEGGKLRAAVECIEKAAEGTAKKAHLAGEIIDKVEEFEDEVESFMEPVKDQANGIAKEASDQKVEKQNPI